MGISIHYRGRIANPGRIAELRRDLRRFADQKQWELLDLTGQEESDILKILVYPSGQFEPVFFLFDSEGRLHPPFRSDAEGGESQWCSVKTQYEPVEAHVQIVELLRQIQRDYIPDLDVLDEGTYWDTQNIEKLRSARELLMHQVGVFLEGSDSAEADAWDREKRDEPDCSPDWEVDIPF